MPKISPRHALTEQEASFCRIYVAFGEENQAEAYRRSHMVQRKDGEWVLPPRPGSTADVVESLDPLSTKEVSRRAGIMLKQSHIKAYIKEIGSPPGDTARGVIGEQALFGDDGAQRKAAEMILSQEDKLGFKNAVDRWVEILTEIGAEIEVPLPAKCPHCKGPLSAKTLFKRMFPNEDARA